MLLTRQIHSRVAHSNSMNPRQLCGLSNRIELASCFASSSASSEDSANAIAEAITIAVSIVDRVDPQWLRMSYNDCITSGKRNCNEHGSQSPLAEMMHQLGVYQRAIARLGDQADTFSGDAMTWQDIANSLDLICDFITQDSPTLQKQLAITSDNNPLQKLANVFYGLTLVIGSLELAVCEACKSDMVSAAAMLVSHNADALLRATMPTCFH